MAMVTNCDQSCGLQKNAKKKRGEKCLEMPGGLGRPETPVRKPSRLREFFKKITFTSLS